MGAYRKSNRVVANRRRLRHTAEIMTVLVFVVGEARNRVGVVDACAYPILTKPLDDLVTVVCKADSENNRQAVVTVHTINCFCIYDMQIRDVGQSGSEHPEVVSTSLENLIDPCQLLSANGRVDVT